MAMKNQNILMSADQLVHSASHQSQDLQTLKALASLWDEPIVYVQQFSQALGDSVHGFFISIFTELCMPGEWLPLNDAVISELFHLSSKQWRRIKTELTQRRILIQRRPNLKSNLREYTLNDDLLETLIRQNSQLSVVDVGSRPLSLNRLHTKTLLYFGASIKAVLLLAAIQLHLGHQSFGAREQFSPYITLSNTDIQALTCLSRTELTNAQKWLSDNNVIEYKYDGFPRVKYFRINYKTLATLSQQVLAL